MLCFSGLLKCQCFLCFLEFFSAERRRESEKGFWEKSSFVVFYVFLSLGGFGLFLVLAWEKNLFPVVLEKACCLFLVGSLVSFHFSSSRNWSARSNFECKQTPGFLERRSAKGVRSLLMFGHFLVTFSDTTLLSLLSFFLPSLLLPDSFGGNVKRSGQIAFQKSSPHITDVWHMWEAWEESQRSRRWHLARWESVLRCFDFASRASCCTTSTSPWSLTIALDPHWTNHDAWPGAYHEARHPISIKIQE